MAFTSSTTNYHLPLPTDDDKSVWTDNNAAFTAVDTALKKAVDDLAALTSRVEALEATPGVSLAGFVKVDTTDGSGLTNAQYQKLTVQS